MFLKRRIHNVTLESYEGL